MFKSPRPAPATPTPAPAAQLPGLFGELGAFVKPQRIYTDGCQGCPRDSISLSFSRNGLLEKPLSEIHPTDRRSVDTSLPWYTVHFTWFSRKEAETRENTRQNLVDDQRVCAHVHAPDSSIEATTKCHQLIQSPLVCVDGNLLDIDVDGSQQHTAHMTLPTSKGRFWTCSKGINTHRR
jgi:hypothetical protein